MSAVRTGPSDNKINKRRPLQESKKEKAVMKLTWLLDSVRNRESESAAVVVGNEWMNEWVSAINNSQTSEQRERENNGNRGLVASSACLFKVNAL